MKDMVGSSMFTRAVGRHTGCAVLCNDQGYVIKSFSQAWPGLIMVVDQSTVGVHSFLPLDLRPKTEVL